MPRRQSDRGRGSRRWTTRRRTSVLTVVLSAVLMVLAAPALAQPQDSTVLTSPDGRYRLAVQADGNAVVYAGARPVWATMTFSPEGVALRHQSDGNLVLYSTSGRPLWSSQSYGSTRLLLQDDGNLVAYAGSTPVWYSGWDRGLVLSPGRSDQLAAGMQLSPGQELRSPDGRTRLSLQQDGNLVVYRADGTPQWNSGTFVRGVRLVQQADGNLVLYTPAGRAVWHSGTYGGAARLAVQDDGNLVVYRGRTPVWYTGWAGARTTPGLPFFDVTTLTVTRDQLGATWRPGCVDPTNLRRVLLPYYGADGVAHRGELVLHRSAVEPVVRALRTAYEGRFPIERMESAARYGGDDEASMRANNTSAYNCRPGEHSNGTAVDINPLVNPYVQGGTIQPATAGRYVDRDQNVPGMIKPGDVMVRAFAAQGWGWGGSWRSLKDYQHFSANDR
ncbi:M15 family metallopeptidase [Pseudokineococcus sp. 1T1Z-3]|uniref:M15 family metallopeptidase n=1 Tax=Pseudokineococcus sp. 1T1Z-3 TaxID=3132745 RepID=UPI003096F54C